MELMSNETTELLMKVMKVIDLYEQDNDQPFVPTPGFRVETNQGVPDEVPYGTICPCNPANGGSGICGCVMGNKMVPNPNKYKAPVSNWGTAPYNFPPGTTITNTPGNSSITINTTN